MAHLDIGKTAFAGFGVIRANPLAVLAWAVVIFVLGILPAIYAFTAVAPAFYDFFQKAASGAEPSVEDILAFEARMMGVNPLLMAAGLALRAILACAVFRAVLEPQARRFAFLRVGMAELMVLVVMICMTIIVVLAGVGVIAAGGIVAAVLAAAKAQEAIAAVMIVAVLGAAVVTVWLGLRLSMSVPMSFADRSFRLFESWRLTRGHALGLLMVTILLIVVIMLMETVLSALAGAAVVGMVLHSPPDETAIAAFFSRPPQAWIGQVTPWAVGAGAVLSLVGAVFAAVAIAPWASAYAQLAAPEPEAAPAA